MELVGGGPGRGFGSGSNEDGGRVGDSLGNAERSGRAGEGGREAWWLDGKTSSSLSESPPCSVSRVRRLLSIPPCNMRRRVVRCHAKATQSISEILVQVQLQFVNVLVGSSVTGED